MRSRSHFQRWQRLGCFLRVSFLSLSLLARAGSGRTLSENARLGTEDWLVKKPATPGWPRSDSDRTPEIQGYAGATSVNTGEEIQFFVDVRNPAADPEFRIEVFRLGWYGGKGGRRMSWPSVEREKEEVVLPSNKQRVPVPDPLTGMIDCDWSESWRLRVPESSVSGVYIAKLTTLPSGLESSVIFVVREDLRSSDFLFQCSVTTWQAYNPWGGRSLYNYPRNASVVSFNRPYAAPSFPFSHTNSSIQRPELAFAAGTGEFFVQIGARTEPAW
ncbi:MAG: hypothetical protein FJ405_11380 [Verrucomicrobia bacterium]|nr:hypothetical protein [Verrucomicrobiota bacterium]